jgi:membrane protease YdiL (CAAX protease family)
MGGAGVWGGLRRSAFLADITARDRDPARIAAAVIGGACVGLVASVACWILVLVPYTFLIGLGREGLLGLGKVALMFKDADAHDLSITVLRLVESTATDGAFPLAFVALAATITSRPFQHYVTAARRIRWRLVVVGLGLSVVTMAPLVIASRLSAGGPPAPILDIAPSLAGRLVYVLAALLLIPSAAAEELMFRGWLMRQLAAFSHSPGVLVFATAIAFAAAHFDFSPDAFLTRTLMGAGFAYMTLRVGGIELATGAHAANNILFILFIEPLNPAVNSGGGGGLPAGVLLGDVVLVAGYVALAEATVRMPSLRRWAGVDLADISPAAALAAA